MSDNAAPSHRLTLEREIFVPCDVLFELWTRPEHLGEWYTVAPTAPHEARGDPVVGGRYEYAWQDDTGRAHYEHGRFERLEAPALLVRSVQYERAGERCSATLTVEFRDSSGSTDLTIVQEGDAGELATDRFATWPALLDQMLAYLSII